MPRTDEDLLQNLINDDCKAFDDLYMRYAPHVEAFAYCMLKNKNEAEDLAHDLFLKIWENRSALQNVRSFKNYLFRMTKNAIFDRFEHRSVQNRVQSAIGIMEVKEVVSEDLAAKIDQQDLLLLINLAIEKMPEQRKRVFRMSRFDGIPQQEIAQKLEISQKTVEYHIRTALAELRKLVQILSLFI